MSFFGFECSACRPSDPGTSTVKVNMDEISSQHEQEEAERQMKLAEESERQRLEHQRAEEELAMEQAREAERQAQIEEEGLQLLMEQMRVAEEEKQLQEALAASQTEADEAAAAAAEQERQRQDLELQAQERKTAVTAFFKKFGFTGVNNPKKSLMSSTYPLHKAAEIADDKLVATLLLEGANLAQKNSSGKTAAQVAENLNKKGSHANVLEALTSGRAPDASCGGA
eukprot:TRINITY_DN16990_c0_g1_i1.p1 TRINITY_DN16990_c0_g1~~TRINITY_DN16990_c0_g1_i1.p1  ORF type:complete len:227 (+),score=79.11 TRINITY_DN16990_c0_g1_i1:103-783(+)